ncbi:MAG: LicD family protein [Candidimonas sp.]|nr:LicD family protein [Candidimonas sp.]
MFFSKSYFLINLLNREHKFLRYPLAGLAWMGGLICTGNPFIASNLGAGVLKGEVKKSIRRAGWIARNSWLRTSIVNDPFFLFSEGLGHKDLRHYDEWLSRREPKLTAAEYASNRLIILAQRIHLLIEDYNNQSFEESNQHPAWPLIIEFEKLKITVLELPIDNAIKNPNKGSGGARRGDFSKDDARQALADLVSLVPLQEFRWYIISGTFLGLHRDGGFMPHDYDIDIGINAENLSVEKLLKRLSHQATLRVAKLDYHLEVVRQGRSFLLLRKPILVKLVHKNGINIDIFIHYLDGEIRWHGSSVYRWDNIEFGLVRGVLEGIPVLQPDQADRYLTENYGDWRIPVTDFNCSSGTPNLAICHNFLSHALFVKKYLLLQGAGGDEEKVLKQKLLSSQPVRSGMLYENE